MTSRLGRGNPAASVIRVAPSTEDFLVTAEGEPVWPLRDDTEPVLRALATTFGASLVEAPAVSGVTRGGDEIVLGIGDENARHARLYAHLTGRSPRTAATLDGATALDGVRIIICQWHQLGFSALDRICSHAARHSAIGLIVGHSPGSMRNQLLTRAAAARLPGSAEATASVVCTDWHGTEKHLGNLQLLGMNAEVAALSSALSRGASLVSVTGHGDGLDLQLGAKATMCGVIGQDLTGVTHGTPDCAAGGYCYRMRLPLGDALAEDSIIDPRSLRCRIGLFSSCFTIPARGALVHPEWSLLARWLDNPSVGAILAPIGLSVMSLPGRLELTQAILAQSNVGAALEFFNRGKHAKERNIRMCLFGDPRVELVSEPLFTPDASAGQHERRHRGTSVARKLRTISPAELVQARGQLLLRLLHAARRTTSTPEVVGLLDEAASVLRRSTEALGQTAHPQLAGIRQATRAAVLGLLNCDPLWQITLGLAASSEEVPELMGSCAVCGEDVHVYRQVFRVEPELTRLQGRCDRCGVTSDYEEASALAYTTLELSEQQLELPDPLRRSDIRVGLRLRPWHRTRETCELLSPPEWLLPDGALESGTNSVHMLTLDDALEIAFLRRHVRRDGSLKTPGQEDPAFSMSVRH